VRLERAQMVQHRGALADQLDAVSVPCAL
jgi:hypothetical protein